MFLRKRGAEMYQEIAEISDNRRLFKIGLVALNGTLDKVKRQQAAYYVHIGGRLTTMMKMWTDYTSNRCYQIQTHHLLRSGNN